LKHQILKLDGFCETYCQIKWIFPSIIALIKSLIFLKTHSHAKMAPDNWGRRTMRKAGEGLMLFEGKQRVKGVKLGKFIRWARESFERNDGHSPTNGVLALPPIQRNAAWGPRQVVDVWDSVLRGLPLGTLNRAGFAGGPMCGCPVSCKQFLNVSDM
jgi:hypothetical protein